jgi:hypothetical protein
VYHNDFTLVKVQENNLETIKRFLYCNQDIADHTIFIFIRNLFLNGKVSMYHSLDPVLGGVFCPLQHSSRVA